MWRGARSENEHKRHPPRARALHAPVKPPSQPWLWPVQQKAVSAGESRREKLAAMAMRSLNASVLPNA